MKLKTILFFMLLCAGNFAFAGQPPVPHQTVFKQFDTIRVTCPMGGPPYSFLDEDGQVKGTVVELWQLWSEKTGIKVRFISGNWKKTVEDICSGKADVHASFDEPNHPCLTQVVPIADFGETLFWSKDIFGIKTIEDLAGIRIGIIKGTIEESYVRQHYPNADLRLYFSLPEIIEAAKKKEIKAMIAIEESVIWWLKKKQILSEFQFDPKHPLVNNIAYAAVKKGHIDLAEAVKQGMNLISADERAAIERKWLHVSSVKTPDTLVIAMSKTFQPFTFVNSEGELTGLLVDMWKLWSEKTGQKIEFLPSTWSESVENLKNGKADIHSGLVATPERKNEMIFSQPLYENMFCLFFPSNKGKTLSIKELSGQKVAVVKNTSLEEFLIKNHPDIELVWFENPEQIIFDSKNGKWRAFAAAYQNTEAIIMKLGLSGKFETGKEILYTDLYRPAVLDKNKELLNLIDKGFDMISYKELVDIEQHWIPDTEKQYYKTKVAKVRLSAEEKKWLNDHKTVRIGVSPEFPPFLFFEDGTWKGIHTDYFRLISERTGIHFELVSDHSSLWEQKAIKGEIDIFPSLDSPERRAIMNFTTHFIDYKLVIITRNEMPFISGLNGLKEKKVAVIKDGRLYDLIAGDYPKIEKYPVNSILDGLEAVSMSEADALISGVIITTYIIQKHNFINLKIAGVADYPIEHIMFAVRKNYPELLSILNKGIASISREEHEAIRQKWTTVHVEHKANWTEFWHWVLGIGSVFIVILSLSFFWNHRLSAEVNERRRMEDGLRKSEAKYRTLFENMTQGVFYQQADGAVIDANNAILDLFGLTRDEFFGRTSIDPRWKVIHEDGSDYPGPEHPSMVALRSGQPVNNAIAGVFNPRRNEYVWMTINAIPQFKPGAERPFQVFVTLHDITKLKQAEERLKDREQNFSLLAENANAGIIVALPDGHHLYANQRAAEILGYGIDDLLKMNMRQLVHPSEVKKLFEIINKRLANEPAPIQYETKIINKDGNSVPIEVTGAKTTWQGIVSDLVVFYDITERKQAEDALRKSEARYRELIERMREGIASVDAEGKITFINEQLANMLNTYSKDMLGKNWIRFWDDDAKKVIQDQLKTRRQGDSSGYEVKTRTPAGKTIWIHISPQAQFNEKGQFIGSIALFHDITLQKQTEIKLKKSQDLLAEAQKIACLGNCEWDLNRDSYYWSDELFRLLGYKPGEIEPGFDAFIARVHPDDRRLIDENNKQIFERGVEPEDHELRIKDVGGNDRILQVKLRVSRNLKNQPDKIAGVMLDITERKQVEKLLQESERKYRMVVQDQTEIISRFLPDGTFTFVNQVFCDFFGKTEHELIGHKWFPVVHTDDLEMVRLELAEMAPSNQVILIENRVYSGKGEYHWFRFINRGFYDKEGRLTEIQSVGHDISVRKQAEEQLKEYSERLEDMVEDRTHELRKAQKELLVKERLAVLGHFAGSVSHELRNPLAIIDAAIFLLNKKLKNADEKINDYLKSISNNVKKSTDIIESLLSLSRMEKPKTVQINAGEFISEILRNSKIPETVETASGLPEYPVFIAIDPEQIRMVLKNIIINAVQAMNESGKITIFLQTLENDRVEISITDTGPGIPPENLTQVFEPLFSTKTHGIGFGLSISRMIIENHGGTIRVDSEAGKGAKFIMILPQTQGRSQEND